MTQTYNAGIYCRLSRDDERIGESVSIENQRVLLACYANEAKYPSSLKIL